MSEKGGVCAMNIELKPIAEKKIEQLGGDVCGVLVRKGDKLAAVDEHGRVTWLQSGRGAETSNELPPINSTVKVYGGVYRSDDMQWMESPVYAHVDGKVLAKSTTHAASFELYPMSRVRPAPQPPQEGEGDE